MPSSDPQLRAIESVSARASALTRWIAALILTPAVLLGFPMYFVLREIQLELIGMNLIYVSAGVAVAATLGPGILLARLLCRLAVHGRRRAWIERASVDHGVPAADIAE